MAKGSDNPFPSLLLAETAAASIATPAADHRRLFVDTDGSLKWKTPGGDVESITVPAGGTDGQVLTKASDDDFDLEWADAGGGGGGGDAWTEIVASADEDVTNSSTFVSHSQLLIAATAGDIWDFMLLLAYSGNSGAPDFKCRWLQPAEWRTTYYYTGWSSADGHQFSSAGSYHGSFPNGAEVVFGTDAGGHSVPRYALMRGMVYAGTTASIVFQFANNTTGSGNVSRVEAGSILRKRKIVP